MIKLVVFDLDETLAVTGQAMLQENIKLLKSLEEKGVAIAVCSGKPTYYLCGFMRQIGLNFPVLLGENGATAQFGIDLPPKKFYTLPYSEEARQSLPYIKKEIDKYVPGIWYQPNEVGVTPFPRSAEEFGVIAGILKENEAMLRGVEVYRHADSFDIVPKGISKKAGLQKLGAVLGISPQEMAAVGDGVNDYPMFEYAGLAVGVNVRDEEKVDRNFGTLREALEFLHLEVEK